MGVTFLGRKISWKNFFTMPTLEGHFCKCIFGGENFFAMPTLGEVTF